MEREEIKYQLELFKKAYDSMRKWIEKSVLNELERDWVIQRFEFTIELTWKTLKKILEFEWWNNNLFPREIIKEFAKKWIITEPKLFIDFLDLRNNASHNYDEDMIEEMFLFIKNNYKVFDELIKELENLIK